MALQLYQHMLEDGVIANQCTYVILIKACAQVPDVLLAGNLFAEAQNKGFVSDVVVGSTLISMYGRCGLVEKAEDVFARLAQHDVVSWTAMLLAYAEHSQGEKALQLYRQMCENGVHQDQQIFVTAFQACCAIIGTDEVQLEQTHNRALEIGQALDADYRKAGFVSNIFVGSALICLYGKCGSVAEAENAFTKLLEHDVVLWSAMLSAYAQQGYSEQALHLYVQMHEEGIGPDPQTFVIALQASGLLSSKSECSIEEGKAQFAPLIGTAIHADIEMKGLASDIFVANSLVSMYCKCFGVIEAVNIFEKLSERDTVTWNTLLSAYVEKDQGEAALQLFRQMQAEGLNTDQQSFVSALQACGALAAGKGDMDEDHFKMGMALREIGLALYSDVLRNGFTSDVCVVTAFISMCGKCGSLIEAELAFHELSCRDAISWFSIISAHLEQGKRVKALQLYRHMQEEGVKPDQQLYLVALQACTPTCENFAHIDGIFTEGLLTQDVCLEIGQSLDADIQKSKFASDNNIRNAVISMYGKCGSIEEAERAFIGLLERTLGSWNAMLSAYVEQDQGGRALELYKKMEEENVAVDDITILWALVACRMTGCLIICEQVHFIMIVSGYDFDSVLGRALIRAYGACTQMADSQAVLDRLPIRSVASWTACITSYAEKGSTAACLLMLDEMQVTGAAPDELTFLSLLYACNRSGLSNRAMELFSSMSRDYGLTPNLKHYVTLIDLLGRTGKFGYIERMLSEMPIPANWVTWLSVLGACRKYGNLKLGKFAFGNAVTLRPDEATAYGFMQELYADAGSHVP